MVVDNRSLTDNGTSTGGYSSHSESYFLSLAFVTFPGVVTNSVALSFIVRDVRKAAFPAIILLLALCSSDLVAVISSMIRHTVARYVPDQSELLCVTMTFIHSYFKLYAGFINSLMAIDRFLAVCCPYLYHRSIHVGTWRVASLIGAGSVAILCLFPVVGLGGVWRTSYVNGQLVRRCSSDVFHEEPHKRLFGLCYGAFGILVAIILATCNALVIKTVLRLNSRVQAVHIPSLESSPRSPSVSSFEIAFAKLMGCLAVVYLVCGVPFSTTILLTQFNYKTPGSVKGPIHILSGLGYTVDPIVYILIRKTHRRRLADLFLRCKIRSEEDTVGA